MSKKRAELRRALRWQRRAAARQGRGRRGGGAAAVGGQGGDGDGDGEGELNGFEPTPWLVPSPWLLAWTTEVDASGVARRYALARLEPLTSSHVQAHQTPRTWHRPQVRDGGWPAWNR